MKIFAVEQQEKIWPGFDLTGPIFDSKFVYDVTGQARYNFTTEVYDETRLEGALGYKLSKTIIFWLGDRHTIPHSHESIGENDTIQYLTWEICNNRNIFLTTRFRLEQRKANQFEQMACRYRQRITLVLPQKISSRLSPLLMDEIFLNLNHPDWVNDTTVNQNRAVIGIRIKLEKNVDLDVAYMNQYVFRNTVDHDNHVVYINLNLRSF